MEVFLLLCLLPGALAYSQGGPEAVCDTMRPSHGRRANYYFDDDPPFSIDVSGDGTYTAGQSLEVELKATSYGRTFKGFYLEARPVKGGTTTHGTFTHKPYRTDTRCGNSALTHRNARSKSSVETTWTAPRQSIGDIMFVATVVERYSNIYMNVTSAIIRDLALLEQQNAKNLSPSSLNGTALIDPSRCSEDLLVPISWDWPDSHPRANVAILCTDDAQCPCEWRCCARCDAANRTCEGHAICRQPSVLPAEPTASVEDV